MKIRMIKNFTHIMPTERFNYAWFRNELDVIIKIKQISINLNLINLTLKILQLGCMCPNGSSSRLAYLVNGCHMKSEAGILSIPLITNSTRKLRIFVALVSNVLSNAIFSFIFLSTFTTTKLAQTIHVKLITYNYTYEILEYSKNTANIFWLYPLVSKYSTFLINNYSLVTPI